MEFGILFTSHPNTDTEPYPYRDVHARVTREILWADEIGFDYAWVAEHHFSNQHGIMPDVFVYAAYLAALTTRIKIGTAVVTLPLANPQRVVENAAFVDILSAGRFALGLGSGYRKYEFDGFGMDFEGRRDIQEEALPLLLELSYHHIGNRISYFAKLKDLLAPNGQVAIVDFKLDAPEAPPPDFRFAPERVASDLDAAGTRWSRHIRSCQGNISSYFSEKVREPSFPPTGCEEHPWPDR